MSKIATIPKRSDVQPIVTVIIVNWNGRGWLTQCLPTLAKQTFRDFEVVVVDNGSTDGTVTWLAEFWPQVQVLPLAENIGFAAANNKAIEATECDFVVLLNNDTLAAPNWLSELVTAVNAPDIGMVASQIVRWHEPHLLDSAGIEVDLVGIAWNRGWMQHVNTAQKQGEVFGPAGAAALYVREMLNDIGLFEARFFAYYEDVDLAWRGQRAGWRCRYAPTACVTHWHSATAATQPSMKTYYLGRNKMWMIARNYEWPLLLLMLPLIIVYDGLSMLYHTLRERRLTAIRARIAGLIGLRWAIKSRIPAKQSVQLQRPLPFRK